MRETARHTRRLEFDDHLLAGELFGPHNRNLAAISRLSDVAIDSRGTSLSLSADSEDKVNAVSRLMAQLYGLLRDGRSLGDQDIERGWRMLSQNTAVDLADLYAGAPAAGTARRRVHPKTVNQRTYLEAMGQADLIFAIGPAGTGKTYLAVAVAVAALLDRTVKRLVLTRPAVEAGERLGFLPGDLVEKVNPYLRPLYDALHDMLDFAKVQEWMATGRIEVAPLAFMRGRTLNDAFIILDEAQNTTPEQMKMFLTRLGFNSRAVVTGDVTQIDLPNRTASGLIHARKVLSGVEGITFVDFGQEDVIRHPLVGRIVSAYERFDDQRQD